MQIKLINNFQPFLTNIDILKGVATPSAKILKTGTRPSKMAEAIRSVAGEADSLWRSKYPLEREISQRREDLTHSP